MVLFCGIAHEIPLQMVIQRLDRMGGSYAVFDQRTVDECSIWYEVGAGTVRGELRIGQQTLRLTDIRAVYQRMMDFRCLPEIEQEANDSPKKLYWQKFHEVLTQWIEIAPGIIINRLGPSCSNGSKPFQAQLIQELGFSVPESLITNDPALVREFRNTFDRIVYKSISGVRSIVQTLEDSDLERLENIRWCPTHFQAYVKGIEIRVHTIGDEVYATAINSEATDYRYAESQVGKAASLTAVSFDDDLAARCLRLSRALNLEFAGIDLKITPDGRVYCFEVNPCPAFSYFELSAGQAISDGVARRLLST